MYILIFFVNFVFFVGECLNMAGPLDDNREAEDEFGSADPPSVRSST